MAASNLTIEQLFTKSIHRPINGVIQAGQLDEETIVDELEEYVMTEEITENMELFYKNYTRCFQQPTKDTGVWISGFFGSGKSHLLKILSYLLDNKEVGGKKPVQYFADKKIKKQLFKMMSNCSELPSDAILFNIDSKSTTNKNEKEKIVEVFLRVFNTHLGYSNTLWIAEIERQLDEEGLYEPFKKAFAEIEGKSWEDNRSKVKLKRKSFIKALSQVGIDEETAKDFLASATKTFEINSERFAKMVAAYCRQQGKDYRLVFLVDEMGQYVGDNVNLMLNLQTMAEDLGNYAKGQVWVCVTSQEKIDAVTNLRGTNDFSKIQGRFATRMNLSSANTDEVIKRRLLDKKEPAIQTLGAQYDVDEQAIKNLLALDMSHTALRSGYRSREEFVQIYPFVPYQVELLQKVFNKIRRQGEGGAHLAHGERSLLKAFQEVAQDLSQEKINCLASFAQFFNSVKRFLDTNVTSTIRRAEGRVRNHEGLESFDIDVLKTLYMIKGIDEVSTTVENITTLLVDSTDCIKNELEKKVKESLQRLQVAMLIEQHADQTYAFLSDEEQEINKEIKSEEVSTPLITEKLGKIFYEEIYSNNKYRFQNSCDFDFNKRFNGYTRGQMVHPLTLQVYTGDKPREQALLESSSGTLVMYLPNDEVAVAEDAMKYAEQISSFTRRKLNKNLSPTQREIFNEKIGQINGFEQKAKAALIEACSNAVFFIEGQERTFKGEPQAQVDSAFDVLVRNTYSKLNYIEEPVPLKNGQKKIMQWAEHGLMTLSGDLTNKLAYEEMLRYLEDRATGNERVTLKALTEQFRGIPYGWSELDIAGLVAALQHDGKIKLKYLDKPFDYTDSKFITRLTKVAERDKVIVECQVEMPALVKREVAAILRDNFGQVVIGETYDEVAKTIKGQISKKLHEPLKEIDKIRDRQDKDYPYPGEMTVLELKQELGEFLALSPSETLVGQFIEREDDLDDWVEKLDTLASFYQKSPRDHFDRAVKFLRERENDLLGAQSDTEILNLKQQMEYILVNPQPYRDIPLLPQLIDQLTKKLADFADQERQKSLVQMQRLKQELEQLKVYYAAQDQLTNMVLKEQSALDDRIEQLGNTDSVSKVYLYAQMASQGVQSVKDKLQKAEEEDKKAKEKEKGAGTGPKPKKKTKKTLQSGDLLELIGLENELEIQTPDQLEALVDTLKRNAMKLLQEHVLVIKR